MQYLVSEGTLEGELRQTLSFDCRPNSNYTLTRIQKVLAGQIDDENSIEQAIENGIRAIRQKFEEKSGLNKDDFVSRLAHVVLYRIEVPEHTDLNRYFEIMNTRGEQLEQHDILKAQLMGYLNDRGEQEFFSKIWNACSDMTGYVQMHFSPTDREKIFGNEWNGWPADEWTDYQQCFGVTEESEKGATVAEIVDSKFKIDDIDGLLDNNIHVRFDSIIDFPYFLLHALRVFVELNEVSLEKPLGDLLDDKKLISDFKNVISLGKMIDLFDDGVRFVVCFGNKSNDCPRQHICETRSVWKTVSDRISDVLEGVSLESVLDQYRHETDRESEKKIVIRCINRKGDIPL